MFFCLALIQCLLLSSSTVCGSSLICQHGATYDVVYNRCLCTPNYHGVSCESSFTQDNPCLVAQPVLADTMGSHRPGSRISCAAGADSCEDFSKLRPGWFRLSSPAGNSLTEGCVHSARGDCGSFYPYIVDDLARENTNSRALFSGNAYQVQRLSNGKCHLSKEQQTHFPVRLLICSAELSLYFLYPLPRDHHYCIGQPLARLPRVASVNHQIVNSPFVPDAKPPKLELEYYRLKTSGGQSGNFICTVSTLFKQRGINYIVKFLLTDKFGITEEVKECRASLTSFRGTAKPSCPTQDILRLKENIYGANLVCQVQLSDTTDSNLISSNIHSFTFNFSFSLTDSSNGTTVGLLRPNDTVHVCIDTRKVPVLSQLIKFRVSVGRQRTIPKDGIDISVVHWARNGSRMPDNATSRGCEFQYYSERMGELCIDLVLYNRDPDGRVVFGLSNTEQVSLVKLNISYGSISNGIRTGFNGLTNRLKFELLESLELKVDLRTLSTNPLNYLHIFSDPFVKPVSGSYKEDSVYELSVHPGQTAVFDALRHKILPYQVQVLISRPNGTQHQTDASVTKRVAIRYGNYIIRVHSSVESGRLQYDVFSKLPNEYEARVMEQDLRGVTIEPTTDVVRIKLDFYGTIIYVWRFRTRFSPCSHGFVMTQLEMQLLDCKDLNMAHKSGGDFVLDVVIVPGFFDTEGNVEGLMYTKLGSDAAIDRHSGRSLFSSSYAMPELKSLNSIFMPVEVLKLCSCNEQSTLSYSTEQCIANVKKVRRNRRPIRASPGRSLGNGIASGELADGYGTISVTAVEARRFCLDFLKVRSGEKRYSVDFCSAVADYMAQFKFVCVRYAMTLQSYEFAESLFNSMLGICQEGLTYNATEVRDDNGLAASRVESELCPKKCSGKGACLSGSCVCVAGFAGADCGKRVSDVAALPTVISTPQQGPLCTSDVCQRALIEVAPMLKPYRVIQCRVAQMIRNKTSPEGMRWTLPAMHMTDNLITCNLSQIHSWVRESGKLFIVVEIFLESDSWKSSNSIQWLLHQKRCSDRPLNCSATASTWSSKSATMIAMVTIALFFAPVMAATLYLCLRSARQPRSGWTRSLPKLMKGEFRKVTNQGKASKKIVLVEESQELQCVSCPL